MLHRMNIRLGLKWKKLNQLQFYSVIFKYSNSCQSCLVYYSRLQRVACSSLSKVVFLYTIQFFRCEIGTDSFIVSARCLCLFFSFLVFFSVPFPPRGIFDLLITGERKED